MDKKIISHFKSRDPLLYAYIAKIEPLTPFEKIETDRFFQELCDSIVSQQLAGKAAATIFGRFKALFPKGEITPKKVLKIPDEKLRTVGLSRAKASYIKDLAQKVESEELDLGKLVDLPDEEVILELVKVKGIGKWTAEMFLMFTLGKQDIFSYGDLGLRNGLKKVYGEKTAEELEKIINNWSPYKTVASRILWRSLDIK